MPDEYEYKDVEELTEETDVSDTDKFVGFNANEGLQISAGALAEYVLSHITIDGTTLKFER